MATRKAKLTRMLELEHGVMGVHANIWARLTQTVQFNFEIVKKLRLLSAAV